MIIGAGEAGKIQINEFATGNRVKSRVCCLIDDNPTKWGKHLSGITIVGGRDRIHAAVEKYRIHRIIYAIPSGPARTRKEILDICSTTGYAGACQKVLLMHRKRREARRSDSQFN